MVARAAPGATAASLAALGDAAAEIIHGAVVYKAEPSAEHGDAQLGLGEIIRGRFHGPPGGPRGPGGWWILTEVEVELEDHEVYRPDLVGWRRDRMPDRPRGRPIRVRPDWVCEVLSTSNAATDLVTKVAVYHRNGVRITGSWIPPPRR